MKKILLGLVGLLALAIVAVLGLAMTKPDVIHVERSVTAAATPADVFPFANDFTKFVQWSPWSDLDPDARTEFSDPPTGVGAWYSWSGNDQVGSGKMTLTSAAPDKVVHHLEFITPFESQADASMIMKAKGDDQVEITWTYDQQADLMAKVMAVFVDMDAMLGPDYEKGLANLQPMVEAAAVDRRAEEDAKALAAEEAAAEGAAAEDAAAEGAAAEDAAPGLAE